MPAVLPTSAFAQDDDDKSVKQDVKDAGHSTKEATKKTGSKVKKGTKKVVNKSATKTADTADKVADKNETISVSHETTQGGDSHEAKHPE